jgi:hypothetical protein
LRPCFLRQGFLIVSVLGGAEPALAQRLFWNPAITAGGGYDSNVFSEIGSGREDWLGLLRVEVPVGWNPRPRLGFEGRLLNISEWYRTYHELDDPRARTEGRLGLRFDRGRRTSFRLDGNYSESNQPAEVFTDAGLELGRTESKRYGGRASLEQGLGDRSTVELGYSHHVGDVAEIEDRFQSADLRLMHSFNRRTRVGVKGTFERRDSEANERLDSSAATLEWEQEASRELSWSLSAGARFVEAEDPRPEGRANLTWTRGRFTVRADYRHTLGYVPRRTELGERVGESITAGLRVEYRSRKVRLNAGPTYYRTENDSLDTEVWRGLAEVSVMPIRWIGLGASYAYQSQTGDVLTAAGTTDAGASRSQARVGVLIAPWNRPGKVDLP